MLHDVISASRPPRVEDMGQQPSSLMVLSAAGWARRSIQKFSDFVSPPMFGPIVAGQALVRVEAHLALLAS